MKETKRKFYKKICKWKKQILCVGAGIFLGIAAWLAQGMDPVIEAGNVIQRPDIDDGQVDQELYVKGLVDQEKEVVLKLPVSARQYTKEEAYQAYEEILKQLPEWIKGDNLSLEEVRQDLELPAYWQGAGVHLSWQSSDPELVESDGTVHTWEFETGDEAIDQWPVILKVRMTDGNWPEEYEIPIKVRPPLYTEEERTIQEFTSLLTSEEEVQKHQDQVTLPSVYKDREISYSTAREPVFLQMCFLGAVAAVFISLKEKSDKKKAEEEKNSRLNKDVQTAENTATEQDHKTNGLAICMYHYVYDKNNPPKEQLNNNFIEVHDLEAELKYLTENNYYFPTWEEVRKYVKGELLLPKKSVVLTFDDGAYSFLNLGVPLFNKYKVPVTSFLIGNLEGKKKVTKYASDYMTFQSHSYNMHRGGGNIGHGGIFPVMNHNDAVADLQKSIRIGGNSDAFAYPYGDYNDSCIQAVKDAGFKCAVTTEYGRAKVGDDPLVLPRIRMLRGQSLDSFKKLVE